MTSIILDGLILVVTGLMLGYLWWLGRTVGPAHRPGWGFVLSGFAFIFLGAILNSSRDILRLSGNIVAEGTGVGLWVSDNVVYIVGAVLIFLGLWRLLPAVARLEQTEASGAGEPLVEANRRLQQELEERQRAEEALRQRLRELALLNRASQSFVSTLDLDQVLHNVLEGVRRFLGVTAWSAWLVEPETGDIVCQQVTDPQEEAVLGWRLAPGQGIAGWVVSHGEGLIVPDTRVDKRHFKGVDKQLGLEMRSMLSVPLRAKQEVIGALQVVDTEPDRFSDRDLMLLEPLAATAAIAIENARLYEQAQKEINERKRVEAALRLSEYKFRTLAETTAATIFIYQDNQLRYVNSSAETISGYTRAELLSMNFWDLIHPAFRKSAKKQGVAILRGQVPARYELKMVTKDGVERWVDFTAGITEYEGRTAVLGTAFDITERQEAEDSLRKLSHAVEQSPSAVAITNLAGIIEYVNPKFVQMTGFSHQEIVGKRITVFGKQAAEQEQSLWQKIMSGGEWRGEFHNRKKNGQPYWIYASISPIRNPAGEITHIIGVNEDITERKQAEEALRESEARNRALLNAIPDMMFRIGKDGVVLDFKPTKELEPLLAPTDFIGRSINTIGPAEVAEITARYVERAIESGDTQVFEYQLPLRGTLRHYEARLVVSRAQAVEVLSIVRDISERKAREAVVKEERVRIARDLHDGLAQSLYFLGLKLDYIRKQVPRDAEGAVAELSTLKETVQANIQDVRRTIFALRPIDLEGLGFGTAVRKYAREFGEQMELEIEINIGQGEESLPTTLELVMFRLVQEGLNNIAKHAQARRAWIDLRVDPNQAARLTIRDDGIGFDPEAITTSEAGTLGLRQMQERVADLGGRLSIESVPGEGTILRAEIPL
jgi:PAS domain S-box-containing protein